MRGCLVAAVGLLVIIMVAGMFLVLQARETPDGRPEYVALGSSFAAGAGLGALQKGSPLLCGRSINGYPQQLARKLRLPIVDMSCGGAVTKHLLHGGQFFQGPQLRVISRKTRLVTITVGGNDVGYIGDLSMLAARNSGSLFGRLVKSLWSGPRTTQERDYAKVQRELVATLRAIHEQAPYARIILASYPTILPPAGTCPILGLTDAEADMMRSVAAGLAEATRGAAKQGGAILVDMQVLGAAHHACSADPWTYGWSNAGAAPFHPTLRGAEATADAISQELAAHQQL